MFIKKQIYPLWLQTFFSFPTKVTPLKHMKENPKHVKNRNKKKLGTQVFTPIENHEKPLGTQGPIWSEEVIDDKCQHLVKIHHCGCIV